MEYHKQLLTLHLRQNPKEVLIGWYSPSTFIVLRQVCDVPRAQLLLRTHSKLLLHR